MSKKLASLLIIIAVVVSVCGTLFVTKQSSLTKKPENKNYPLLSQRIFQDNPSDAIVNFSSLRGSLNDYFAKNKLSASLYFEYLPTGTSIRINDDELNVAASLIKLTVAMELYKDVELGKISLDKEVTLKPEWLDNGFGTLYEKGAGYKLTLGEANKIMLTQSDNTALKAIINTIDGLVPTDDSPFTFLDTDAVQNQNLTVSISSRSYSSFLKCLYFSCYLNPKDSQDILNLLTQTEFNDRLTAKLNGKVKVAHKIGDYYDQVQSDCGIFYVPQRNYILCIMMDGPENATTDSHVAELSLTTYNFITQLRMPPNK